MVAIARIVVILAVFFLVRFALAHQHRTQSEYSDSDSTSSLHENSASGYESNEKVLIPSGVPLRGRTIHQTAWSEEEKVSVSRGDATQQPSDQTSKEKVYKYWGLTDAINYILSFIYGTEIDESAIISKKLAENSNENLKNNLDDRRNHQNTIEIKDSKEKSEDIPMFDKDRDLKTTPKYPNANLQNHNIERLREDISSLSDEYDYTESDFEICNFSNEITDSEYEEAPFNNEDSDIINKDTINQMNSSTSVVNGTKDNPMRNIIVKPLTDIREGEPEYVSVAKSQESNPKSDENTSKECQEDDIQPVGNTKSDSDERKMKHYNEDDTNIFKTMNRHPKQQSESETMKGFIGTKSPSQDTNFTPELVTIEDIITENSIKEQTTPGNINYDKNEEENTHATSERTTIENIIKEIPPQNSHLQNKRQSHKKDLSSKSNFFTQTENPEVLIDRNKQGKKYEVNHQFATTENFNKLQHEKVFKNPNYVTKTTVKFTDPTPTNRQFKISSKNGKKDINNKNASKLQNESVATHIKPPGFPSMKPWKDREQKHLKSNQRYLDDIYLDLEPDEDVRSYNYLLDSYEFIRVGNNKKVEKKHDSSVYVIIQDKERSLAEESSTILSVPLNPFQDEKEVEVIDKSHESFNTILEYLYKNSNSSFILSLKENNSSGI